jgi:hypothetical protein
MSKKLWQVLIEVEGLIPRQAGLKRRIWLKKDEILLEKEGECLDVHVLHEGEHTFNVEDKILPYLKLSRLLSNSSIHIEGGSGILLASKDEFGKKTNQYLHGELSVSLPEEAVDDIEKHVPKFIRQIRKLHDKYAEVVDENKFLSIAIDFFYEANNKSVFNDEGFLSAAICLEALFNDGCSDISYKIAHRAGFLIGLGKMNSIEAFQNIKSIYSDRCKLIHGGGSLEQSHDPIRYKASHYARISIIYFLILLSNSKRRKLSMTQRKSELLKEIDFAMLDVSRRNGLRKEIERGVKHFELEVPRTFEGDGRAGNYRVTAW